MADSREPDPVQGAGCALIGMGAVAGSFALVALLGLSDRVELEFFEIELNDLTGRLIWLLGCVASIVLGFFLLKKQRNQ